VDANLQQGIADFVDLERLDDGSDELHEVSRLSFMISQLAEALLMTPLAKWLVKEGATV
jgi:hypothetical protein